MHITKIELEDIKSHREATFEFQRGTTAITGENGAGKTTIIEAVAWTLFDLLDYKKDDFVRRGAKKGVARVTFESGLDGREYSVYRDTGTGYYVYDVQLKNRIADKKEEVSRFLWAHLGVEAGTDLEALFRRAIGVPQGTFTAIFLETATERKKAFDKLLKVEEYRQGAEKLLLTSRFIEQKITSVREKIARAEGELARFELVEEDLKNFTAQTDELSKTLRSTEKEVTEKSDTVKKFDATEAKINELKSALDRLQNEKSRAEILLAQKENELNQARNASERIKAVEADYQKHTDALGKLKEFERERGEREKLNVEQRKIETAQINVVAEQKRLLENLEKAQAAHQEIVKLTPRITEQETLEKMRDDAIEQIANTKSKEAEIRRLDEKMNDLRGKFIKNKEQIKEAEARAESAKNYEALQKRDSEITREITRFRAKLEHDEQFQAEVKNGLCPILSQKCLNLKAGETLEGFLKDQFAEIKTNIGTLEAEQKSLAAALRVSREAEKFSAMLETLKARETEISDEGKSYKAEKENLLKDIGDLAKIQSGLAETEAKLKDLGNPKARIQMLETEVKREVPIRENLSMIEKNLERLESDKRINAEKLESYKDLDANWKQFSDVRDRTANAHREFLTNENLAKLLPEKEKEFAAAKSGIEQLKIDLSKAEKDFEAASKDYDRELHQTEKFALLEAERRLAETRANLANAERQKIQAENELNRLAQVRKAMQTEFQEKERLEKIAEATDFIRETLKKSAPLVAKNYIYYVSLEANQMFREISGNAERTLKWTEDYGIILEEDGYERPFVNLSGGEQMAAALSVRLALLKQLSDVRLAFFDEPTTNMDAARRERLAEQISHITERKTFDQLFVISHDDTFAGFTDHEVSVRGSENE
ncbi:MAG TPA: SMC family ATPase [Pyrinomonadaceae bacterium]|nr:SMC family ATPase [Pyrinomonadaceae bacterium]